MSFLAFCSASYVLTASAESWIMDLATSRTGPRRKVLTLFSAFRQLVKSHEGFLYSAYCLLRQYRYRKRRKFKNSWFYAAWW
ncbi:hypothetical protein BJ508DRAFT_37627 [Ascobolus immersus RN42]|uniref:Secreted protein n=1 Tax=Ascobolus immersus RN42 TaxID=1160509 RepID=A0A3N4IE12_ASCIM|nr:hypothetical protein BJ508DRAFT_37627 [Ascobolus immersus RN42]